MFTYFQNPSPGKASFVSVPTTDPSVAANSDNKKEIVGTLAVPRALLSLRSAARSILGSKEHKINLYQDQSFVTTANTAYATVQSLSPANTGEITSVANLYDEIIVDGFSFRYSFSGSGTLIAGCYPSILAYDPIEVAVLSSVLNGMQHEQKSLFFYNVTTASGSMDQTVSTHGHITWDVRVKLSSARNQDDAKLFGHDWSNTSGSNAAIYGYFKPYIPVLGATGVLNVGIITTFHCRARCRT